MKGLDATRTVTIFLTPEHTQLKDNLIMSMTKAEALAIVVKEIPCDHDSWEDMGKSVVPRCTNCKESFTPEQHVKAKAVAARFREALDLLAAEPTAPTGNTPVNTQNLELMSLLLKIAETHGTFGTLRECDYPYNGAATRFKRVKDVVLTFHTDDQSMRIYILRPGAPFGMGGVNYSHNDISCLEVIALERELYQGTVQWKLANEKLRQQWNDAVNVSFIEQTREAMR